MIQEITTTEINKKQEINKQQITDICIPRMENNRDRNFIYKIFRKIDIGKIERITENILKTDPEYKRVIIKLKWNNTEKANEIRMRLYNNQPVNIVYEIPWFWKLLLSNK
jgi:hypothetical protein